MRHGISAEERHRMIAEAAYYLSQNRGFVPGEALRDWFEAEAEIDRRLGERQDENQLDEWHARLDDLKSKAKEAGAEIREDLERQIESLSARLNEIRPKIRERLARPGEVWEDLHKAFDHISARLK